MTACPICTKSLANDAEVCQGCGSNLTLLAQFDNLAVPCYNEALVLVQKGDLNEAQAKLRAALSFDPRHAPSLMVLGKLLAQQGAYGEAITVWKKVIEATSEPELGERAARAMARAESILMERQETEKAAADSERQRRAKERLRQRLQLVAGAAAVCLVAVLSTVWATSRPVTPQRASESVRRALQQSALLSGRQIAVTATTDGVALSGELTSTADRTVVESVARAAAGGAKVESASLRVVGDPVMVQLRTVMRNLPDVLETYVPGTGKDILDGLRASEIGVAPNSGSTILLTGTVPASELKPFIQSIAASLANSRPIDVSGVHVSDDYIVYTIRPGDEPEALARRLCGTRRRLAAIREFSRQNAAVLDQMRIGQTLRIPKRLLTRRATTEGVASNDQSNSGRQRP